MFVYRGWVTLTELPRRDPEARARLQEAARRGAPLVLARDRTLPVPGPLGPHLPGGALARGAVVTVCGARGAGVTSAALGLAAAATAAGEWAAAVDLDGTWGGLAAVEAGIDPGRFAVVRGVARAQWGVVVAALLDGAAVVLAELPRGVGLGDARRLAARARERSAVLVALSADPRAWPAEAALRVHVEGGVWSGLTGEGALTGRDAVLRVEGRGIRRTSLTA
jgi:hypothetical protein